MPPVTLPLSTYRLHLMSGFTFADATTIVDYLASLGISHCYTSSYFKAVPGSPHGYDVADPTQLNPEIGDEPSYSVWIDTLRAHEMGHVIDLGAEPHGHCEVGRTPGGRTCSRTARASASRPSSISIGSRSKRSWSTKSCFRCSAILYGAALERQEIALQYADGAFSIRYFDDVFPIAPGTYIERCATGASTRKACRDCALLSDCGSRKGSLAQPQCQ